MAQLTKQNGFQRSFELSKGDVQLPKLFRQAVPQCWQFLTTKSTVAQLTCVTVMKVCESNVHRTASDHILKIHSRPL